MSISGSLGLEGWWFGSERIYALPNADKKYRGGGVMKYQKYINGQLEIVEIDNAAGR
jgi:hypothetical protein